MKIKRTTALLMALIMLLALSTGLFSCSKNSPTVMKVGGIEVSYNMLRYFAINYRGTTPVADYEGDEALQQALSDNVYTTLRQLVACQKVADEQEIELSEEEEESIDAQIEAMKAEYESEEAFEEVITAQFGDEQTLRRVLELQVLQSKLYTYLTDEYHGLFKSDDATVRADIEAGNFFAAEYLFVNCSEDDYDEKKAFAEGIHERVANGESMAEIDREYQTTYGLSMDYANLPCFTYTEKLQYFEEAVLALEVGELADLIVRNDGFLIVQRKALDSEYIDSNFMSVVNSYLAREYALYMQDYADQLSIEWESDYENLKLWEME